MPDVEEAWAKAAYAMRWAGRHAMFADDPEDATEVDAVLAEEQTAVRDVALAAFDAGAQAAGARIQVAYPSPQHFQIADWIDTARAKIQALAEGRKEGG